MAPYPALVYSESTHQTEAVGAGAPTAEQSRGHGQVPLWLARAGWVLVVAFVVAALIEMAPQHVSATFQDRTMLQAQFAVWPWMGYLQFTRLIVALEFAAMGVYFATALLIFMRKPHELLAIFVSAALLLMAIPFGMSVGVQFPAWMGGLGLLLSEVYLLFMLIAMTALYAVLPDPSSVPRRLRGFFGFVIALLVGVALLHFYGRPEEITWAAFFVSFLLTLLAMVIALSFQVVRYCHATNPVYRQQIKWIIAGLIGPLLYLLLMIYEPPDPENASSYFALLNLVAPFIAMALPMTIAFAIFRYRLWEIEVVVSRTLIYGALTSLVVLLYIVIVGGLSLLFRSQDNLLIFIMATGLVALLVQPLYVRLQRIVNRLIYGQRDDPATVVRQLGRQLETTAATDTLLATLVQTVASALKLPYVAITLAEGDVVAARFDGATVSVVDPALAPMQSEIVHFPLHFQSTVVGYLAVAPRAPGEKLARSDIRLLETIAHQAGPAVHADQLTAALRRSRQAIVTAREEERRRLRRDLHDGLGPQLASQTLTVDAVIRLLDRDPEKAAALLQDIKRQSQDAMRDIRRLVYELRPPALDDLGLVIAVREQAERHAHAGLSIDVGEAKPLPPLAAAVEVAAFRIAQEALTNVVRHAGAKRCVITFSAIEEHLLLTVADDGCGLPDPLHVGVGIVSMRERAAELGGTITFDNRPESGLVVQAELPL